jgi:putative hydrolase of the HAD superfamily
MIEPGIRAVFFDAVGTLLFPRTPVARTYAEFARGHGATITEEQVRAAFRTAFAQQERLDHSANWRTDENRERTRWRNIVSDVLPGVDADRCFADLWEWFANPIAWAVHAEAGEVLQELDARGFHLGMGSNFDGRLLPLVDAFRELSPIHGRCLISSLVGWRKPAGEFFLAMAQSANCSPAEVLYVGDDPHNDLDGATAAGLKAILYDPADGLSPNRICRLRDLLA